MIDFVQGQQFAETGHRQQAVAQAKHFRFADMLDAHAGILTHPDEFSHRKLGNGKALVADAHDQRRHDRQCQRNANDEARASPFTALTSTAPPMRSMLLRTTSMPTPRPEMLVTCVAVEKPGMKMKR